MSAMLNRISGSNEQVRRSLYEGAIYLLPANAESRELASSALDLVRSVLGEQFRNAHEIHDEGEYFSRIGELRKMIYTSSEFRERMNRVIESCGFDIGQQIYDPARLRAVASNGHLNPCAAPLYYGHRDTWYSHPQSMLTWWIPLHDVIAEETFEFYPEYFARVVENDSEIFDFDAWTADGPEKQIGWQNRDTGRTAGYPSLKESPEGVCIPVIASAADILIFSAQHLHQTCNNVTGQTRFSLDFRTVDLCDLNDGVEAVNVDNRSTGSSVRALVRPSEQKAGGQ